MADILIDLGPTWGHIVPLSTLENITHISIAGDDIIHVQCFSGEETFKFKSLKSFNEKEQTIEKNRLLGLSNGLINPIDMKLIIQAMEAQTGKTLSEVIEKPLYDIHHVRRIWATLHDQPYFRFSLLYDAKTQEVKADEDHNEAFNAILPDWMDPHTLSLVTEEEDRMLLFAHAAIDNMAEPILPIDDELAMMDPHANIPVMGDATQGVAQKVDLSKVGSDNVMMRT